MCVTMPSPQAFAFSEARAEGTRTHRARYSSSLLQMGQVTVQGRSYGIRLDTELLLPGLASSGWSGRSGLESNDWKLLTKVDWTQLDFSSPQGLPVRFLFPSSLL